MVEINVNGKINASITAESNLNASITVGSINGMSEEQVNTLLDSKADINHTHDYNELNNLPEIPSIDGLASEEYVNNKINEIPKVDLSDYALKSEIPNIRVIGNGVDEYVFTGNEFTDQEYEDCIGCSLLLDNVLIGDMSYLNELVYIFLWFEEDNKVMSVDNQYGFYVEYVFSPDGNITTQNEWRVLDESALKELATKEELNEVKQSVSNGKELLASAITDKGVNTSKDDTFQTMANNISRITTGDGPVYENPGFYELRTKGDTDYSYLFYCSRLANTSLDLSNWDTSKVRDMSYMFYCAFNHGNNELKGLENWNTSNVTDMSNMFKQVSYERNTLNDLDLSNWDTSSVTNMSSMFQGWSAGSSNYFSFKELKLNNWDTRSVTNMSGMFSYCYNLLSLNLSSFNTSSVTNMSSMFQNCSSLTSLDLSNFDTSSVTNMSGMFIGCDSLVNLDLTNWDTSNVTNMSGISPFISGCENLEEVRGILDLSSTSGLAYSSNSYYFAKGCSKLKRIQFKNIYKDVSMSNNNKWSINLGDTIVEDQYLISIISELPELYKDKNLGASTNIKLTLPPTNTLTQEQVQPAIDKGWNVVNTTY